MKGLQALSPAAWEDYELIDSGGFEKLERFGRWVTARPEPQAIWHKSLPETEWERLATAVFRREERSEERGQWTHIPQMPEQWWVKYAYKDMRLQMRLGLTAFKHVGIFPEQAENWNFIYDRTREISARSGAPARILNLFAYTGGATLAALAGGGDATHVDSVKQVVGWARENMERSGLDGARWIVDDALKFVKREVKRGKIYDGIILDPPAYGRGPDGEKWVLEQNIGELLEACSHLLAPVDSFLVFNLYSMGLSALLSKTAVNQIFGACGTNNAKCTGGSAGSAKGTVGAGGTGNADRTDDMKCAGSAGCKGDTDGERGTDGMGGIGGGKFGEQFGELYFDDRAGKSLPLGVYYRFSR